VSQIKIYGLKDNLDNIKQKLSETIHSTIVEILSFPKDKKYHRFISLDLTPRHLSSHSSKKSFSIA
jgi:hypothetical protein